MSSPKMIKQEVNKLLEKKMDRLTFLKHIGVGLMAVVGVSSLLRAFGGPQTGSVSRDSVRHGAAAAYGGRPAGSKNETA